MYLGRAEKNVSFSLFYIIIYMKSMAKQIYTGFLLVAICLMVFGCTNNKPQVESSEEQNEISKDFDNFYKKFHRDSAFQLTHIRFPLPGRPTIQDSTQLEEEFYWEKDKWMIHEEVDFSTGEFKQELTSMNDLVIERVFLPQGLFIERRFYKADGDWALIYYSDMNYGRQVN